MTDCVRVKICPTHSTGKRGDLIDQCTERQRQRERDRGDRDTEKHRETHT